jgi:hypothetical protein
MFLEKTSTIIEIVEVFFVLLKGETAVLRSTPIYHLTLT